jgi:branched-chain amino acid aminotransferase
MKPTEFIWHKGKLVPWAEATVHVLAHGLHYGSSVFEGIRVYETKTGPAFFRLDAHLRRLRDSARIYRMEPALGPDKLAAACHEVVRANKLGSAYVRPVIYRGFGTMSVDAGDTPIEVAVAAFEWGAYLGADAIEQGVDVGVSSWTRAAPNTYPTTAKAGGNYLSSQLISMEAHRHGYVEGIALDVSGNLSEGAGENLFLVRDGIIYTTPLSAAILPGITRDTVIALAKDLKLEVREENMPRELLYLADEVFLTGTATEIAAVRSVDGMTVGEGKRGPITGNLQKAFYGLFSGETPDRRRWLELVK